MNKTFVMIHGSWHGGWAWHGVVRQLSKRGHRAQAPTLPGHRPGAIRAGVSHQDCVRSVVSYIQEQTLENVILVGHSFGGSVIQKVAEEIPSLIERTIFLDALIVEDGHCVRDPSAICQDQRIHTRDNVTIIGSKVRALVAAGRRRTTATLAGPISIR